MQNNLVKHTSCFISQQIFLTNSTHCTNEGCQVWNSHLISDACHFLLLCSKFQTQYFDMTV